MEIVFGENNLISTSNQSAFDNVLSAVAGNQYFDQKALQKIQTDDLREAFNDWVENDFMSENDEGGNWLKTTEELEEEERYAGVSPGVREFVKGMDEYREDWDKFNVAEGKRASLRNEIEKMETQQTYEESLFLTGEALIDPDIKKQISQLKAQIVEIKEDL